MMRPGEPPTKESAKTYSRICSSRQTAMTLSAVGRMKFNRRLGRESERKWHLDKEDIVDVLKRWSIFVTARAWSTILTTWVIAAFALLVKWPRTSSVWSGSRRARGERASSMAESRGPDASGS